MTNVMDYLKWRGDLLFTQDPPNAVDAMVFSCLSYICFPQSEAAVTLGKAAEAFLALPDCENHCRGKSDVELLRATAASDRFGRCELLHVEDRFLPEQDTQFAAMTFRLDDGSLVLAFRGTDRTLIGWKEDFNMCFQQTVPAQRLALDYTRRILSLYSAPIRLCGHSKGGNMAVFAAARISPMYQSRILAVYNNDGPGFSDYMMGDPGYLAMVPKIYTYVPQSSVIGMIMEHEEPYTIIRSNQLGILQHDTFSWEVVGKQFVPMEELTADSRFVNRTIKNWLGSMSHEERNRMVETLFDLLMTGDVDEVNEIFHLKSIRSYLKAIGASDDTRRILAGDLLALLQAAKQARQQALSSEGADRQQ